MGRARFSGTVTRAESAVSVSPAAEVKVKGFQSIAGAGARAGVDITAKIAATIPMASLWSDDMARLD